MIQTTLKRCNTCPPHLATKGVDRFHKDRNRRDGRCYQCKTCAKARLVQYRKDQK